MMAPPALGMETISFGPFSLIAKERRLTRDGVPVELNARAYDILLTLLSRPNEIVSKNDLMAEVWPGITVEESNLRFQMASLRRVLGDGRDGARYITTAAGRGYSFVAPIARLAQPIVPPMAVQTEFRHANLPGRLGGMFGRVDDIRVLSERLDTRRFVTIVGSGGVGKTTLAVAVGHQLSDAFAGAVLFVDLSMVSDPALVASNVASLLGLSVRSADATPNLVAHLRDKRMLLIFDTCEHLIEAVAALASTIFAAAPNIHILATSRETLQVDGEHVYRLEPLACPPDDAAPTAAVAQSFPAIQLFVERARASGARLEFSDAEAVTVVSMCRKLDGVALAIELAARRVEAYGVHQTAALLDARLAQWAGPRTAPPRQKTLQATLDWSYGLLSDVERAVLRRLAVFVGNFTLDAAFAVATGASIDQAAVFGAIDSLVAKSMVATRPIPAGMRYRLLDTTRAYALGIRISDADASEIAAKHATYCRQWLETRTGEWSSLSSGIERASHFGGMNNVRAALEWCFAPGGNAKIGTGLAAAAVQHFLKMSLFPECHRWAQRAILALDADSSGSLEEMHLQEGLALSSSQLHGDSDAVSDALNRSLAIAEARGDAVNQARLLNIVHFFHARRGDYRTSFQYARRCRELAETIDDPALKALGHAMFGRALQVAGDIGGSRAELEQLMLILSQSQRGARLLGYDLHYRAGIALARTLWLQGFAAQAVRHAREAVGACEAMGHPGALSLVLAGAATIFIWTGDLDSAQSCTDLSFAHAEANAMGPLMSVGRGRKAELAILRGRAKDGVRDLQSALASIHAARHGVLATEFNMTLARGLAEIGRAADGMAVIDDTIAHIETSGELFYAPELLRLKGALHLAMPQRNTEEAERCLRQSLEASRRIGARGWELRAATDLAALEADLGRPGRGKAILAPLLAQFTEGFETADLVAAKTLLSTLC